MPEPIDLTEVVADATDDAAFDASVEPIADAPLEASAEPAADDPLAPAADPTDPLTAVQDDFDKRWGISSKSATGRENRIPHSRVKQMVSKAEQEAIARITKEMEGKFGTERQPLETKVKDYEDRLTKVAQFEQVLENDPKTFLGLLSQIPAYKEFFDYVGQLANNAQPQTPKTPEGMPQPDQTLPDGTKVYSMEGLQALLDWQGQNVEKRVTSQVEQRVAQRYQPMEQKWQEEQRIAQLVPVIEKQIADARTWPNFAELEPEIVKILKADPQISLERAYVKAYQDITIPKVSVDRNKMRTDILAELRQKPISSSAPSSQVRPSSQQSNESRSLDDIVAQAARDAGLA